MERGFRPGEEALEHPDTSMVWFFFPSPLWGKVVKLLPDRGLALSGLSRPRYSVWVLDFV